MAFNENLYNADAPYVHSSVYHLYTGYRSLASRPERKDRLDQVIAKLNSYIADLRAHEQCLYEGLGVSDYRGLNEKLFGSYNQQTEMTIIYSILTETDFIFSLIPRIEREQALQIAQNFKNLDLADVIQQDMTQTKFRNLLANAIKKSFSADKKTITVEDFVKLLKDDVQTGVQAALSEQYTYASLTAKSHSSNLYKFVMAAMDLSGSSISVDKKTFVDNFTKHYLQKMVNYPDIYTSKSSNITGTIGSEERGRSIAENMYNSFTNNGALPGQLLNLLGELAERGLDWRINSTDWGIDIELTSTQMGKKNENQVAEEIQKTLKLDVAPVMKTIHNPSVNEGQTDNLLVFKDKQGGKHIYRIQSKNKLLDWLQDIEDKTLSSRPIQIAFHKMQDNQEITLSQLMSLLRANDYLTDQDCSTISYLMANIMWFRTHESVMLGNDGVGEASIKGTLVESYKWEAEKVLSYGVGAVLGMGFDELNGAFNSNIDVNSSNIFYFIGNRTLLPVSDILEQVKQRLEEGDAALYKLHYSFDNGTQFLYTTAEDFKKAKKEALDSSNYEGTNYENQNLLNIGTNQGRVIIESLRGHVYSEVNIVKLLETSSYVFGK